MLMSLIAILFLLVLSAFFSGSETALTATSRPLMHELEKQGDHRAVLVNRLHENRERLIGTILLGNNLVNILASALATSVLIAAFGEAGVAYATIAMTFLVLVFAEITPKTFAIRNSNRMALAVAPVMEVLVAVFSPVIVSIQFLVDRTLRSLGAGSDSGHEKDADYTELRGAIDLHTASELRQERAMLRSVLELYDVEVADVMTYRRNMVTFDIDRGLEALVDLVVSGPFTRIPIWRGREDNIIGIVHAKALLRALRQEGAISKLRIEDIAQKPWFILETTSLRDQLQAFRDRREHFAVVIDEYGAVQGIVTLEDILEEIVGDITDEHDVISSGIRRLPDGAILADGWVTIRDLNREFGWSLPDEDASTVAGLLLHETERIPDKSRTYQFYGFRFTVIRKQRNQISTVRIDPPPALPQKAAG